MVEVVRHALGICGEPHLSVWFLAIGESGIFLHLHWIRFKTVELINKIKTS